MAVVTVTSLGIGVAADINNTINPDASAKGDVTLSEETVKKLALNHAGVQEADVAELKSNLDYDDDRTEYEVKFRKDNVKYEYQIDAVTGTILSYDAESKEDSSQTTSDTATTQYISQEGAKGTVLQHAGLQKAEVTFTKVTLDYNDGKAEHEIHFYKDNTKYEYELDAINNRILSWDIEIKKVSSSGTTHTSPTKPSEGNTSTGTTSGTTVTQYISQEDAKTIALQHAGLTEAEVTRLKIQLDYDDGRAEYEIEFQVGQVEYEYEINATAGTILCFEKDIDD